VQLKTKLLLAAPLVASLSAPARAQDAPPPPPPAEAAPAPAPTAPDPRLDEIDQRTRILDRKIELLEEEKAAHRATDAVVNAADRGFVIKSADNAFVARFGGVLQADGREYLDQKDLSVNDTFLLRKARPVFTATFFDIADLRLMPDFGNGTANIQDAYVDLRPFSFIGLRGGKFKTPLGLERAQQEVAVVFPERAFPTSLAPNRDIGFELFGSVLGGTIAYEGGVFNGSTDNAQAEDLDTNHAKDFAGRLFVLPFKTDAHSLLTNLGVGFGASTGNQKGKPAVIGAKPAAAIPVLPSYKSAGQNTIFSYLVNDAAADSTVLSKGRRTRWSPQGYYYVGPVGILGEYIQERQHVVKGTNSANLKHTAWQVTGEAVWGGKPTFEGVLVERPFDPRKGTWGALELAGRYSELDLDNAAFPIYADPTKSVTKAQAFGVALNWHWSRNIKLSLAFEHTKFKGGAASNGDRHPENTLFQMIQGAF
jgi:phosphate-selective porin OprO/OprP